MEDNSSPTGGFPSLKAQNYIQPSPLENRYELDETGIPDLVVENFSPSSNKSTYHRYFLRPDVFLVTKHDNETSSHGNFLTRVREAMFMNEAEETDQTKNGIPTVRSFKARLVSMVNVEPN